jgi:double-stranded uracil-DNA glycosylase
MTDTRTAKTVVGKMATGFAPVGSSQPTVLILGSLPGVASIQEQQYFAHPRNQFWSIMATIAEFEVNSSYPYRVSCLAQHGIMLWDVVHSAYREGSLDSNIKSSGLQVNQFSVLLGSNTIELIAFNGAAAEKYFLRYAVPDLSQDGVDSSMLPELIKMPSTSPANAGMSFEQKLSKWQLIASYI